MSGTVTGGKKAAITNKLRYGNDYYKVQGAKGGVLGTTGGFAANPGLAREAGQKGGFASRRSFTKQQRRQSSELMKAIWAERKAREQLFVADDTDFGEGFGRPTWKQRLMQRIMK